MRRIVFVDLDDTLFQSLRKNPHADRLAALGAKGQPLSFRTAQQEAFFDWLGADALVIPVTGRNVEAFQRVKIPFVDHAICSFGGVMVTPQGTLEPIWHDRIGQQAQAQAPLMADLLAGVAEQARKDRIDVRHRVISDAGLPLYISVKHNAANGAETAQLAAAVSPLVPADWTLHVNAHNMALLPPFLSKAAAVSFFLDRFVSGPVLTIGVGDSLTDLGFMDLCDFAIAPTTSQIMASVMGRPLFDSGIDR
jgi:hydroxymethylpyrimidine pyrophosphatase-like HAD family hydrolase